MIPALDCLGFLLHFFCIRTCTGMHNGSFQLICSIYLHACGKTLKIPSEKRSRLSPRFSCHCPRPGSCAAGVGAAGSGDGL